MYVLYSVHIILGELFLSFSLLVFATTGEYLSYITHVTFFAPTFWIVSFFQSWADWASNNNRGPETGKHGSHLLSVGRLDGLGIAYLAMRRPSWWLAEWHFIDHEAMHLWQFSFQKHFIILCIFVLLCVHMYVHTYIHTYIHTCIHTCIHTYIDM